MSLKDESMRIEEKLYLQIVKEKKVILEIKSIKDWSLVAKKNLIQVVVRA